MRARFLVASVLALAWVSEPSACPFCDGGPSGENEVQAAIFGDDFAFCLLATALPFLASGAVAAVVTTFPRRTRGNSALDASDDKNRA
jgi:hypothetical protein